MYNQYQYVAKKYAFELLQERYQGNLPIIERITHALVTEGDVRDFSQLLMNLYEAGYVRAVDQYREHFKKLGYEVTIGKPA